MTFRVYGIPAPQGSKKHIGRGIMVESSKRVKPWRQDVKLDTREQFIGPPIVGPVFLSITFWIPRPKSHYKTKNGILTDVIKPNAPLYSTSCMDGDIDKLARCTLDGLSAKCGGCVIADDSLVVELTCRKRYVTALETTGATITVVEP